MLNVDVTSPSYIIRDGILDRLKQVPTFQSVALFSRNQMKGPIQKQDIPYIGCYLIEETMSPDGDANHTEPRFVHDVKLGFSIIVQNNDNDAAQQNLDTAFWTILRLLENPKWANFPASGDWNNGEDIRIEAVTRGRRRFNFGPRHVQQETPVAELEMDLTIRHRTDFPPLITDHLDLLHITVAYPWPYDPGSGDAFTVVYDLTTGEDLLPVEPVAPVVPPWIGVNQIPAQSDYVIGSPIFATPTLT
jgi:hypothetical protein